MNGSTTTTTNYAGAALKQANAIISAPLAGNVDTVHLFLVMGVIIVSALIWHRVIAHLKD
jgi:hypothetical protein